MKELTVTLNGLIWDTENLSVNGKTHFSYEEAKAEAAKRGKRLPTKKEFKELLILPHIWDADMRGMWFAEREEDLKSEKSLFLPAYGYNIDKRDWLNYFGMYGNYWSITSNSTYHAYYFGFSGIKNRTYINYYYRYGCFSVRCINDSYNEKKKKE